MLLISDVSEKSPEKRSFHCGYYFSKKGLKDHVASVHSNMFRGKNNYVCSICQKKFGFPNHLTKHIVNDHAKKKKKTKLILCLYCPKSLQDPEALMDHYKQFHGVTEKQANSLKEKAKGLFKKRKNSTADDKGLIEKQEKKSNKATKKKSGGFSVNIKDFERAKCIMKMGHEKLLLDVDVKLDILDKKKSVKINKGKNLKETDVKFQCSKCKKSFFDR